jgi:hypothetical protein
MFIYKLTRNASSRDVVLENVKIQLFKDEGRLPNLGVAPPAVLNAVALECCVAIAQ